MYGKIMCSIQTRPSSECIYDTRYTLRNSAHVLASLACLSFILTIFVCSLHLFSHLRFFLTRAARFLDDALPRGIALRKRITIESIRQGTEIESSVVMLISVQKKEEKKYDTHTHFLSLFRRTAAIALSSTFASFR